MANWWDKNLTDKQKFRLQEPKDPSLLDVVSTVPNPVGDVASGLLAAQDVSKGNYGTAALNALGLLPFIPSMGAIVKNTDTFEQLAKTGKMRQAKNKEQELNDLITGKSKFAEVRLNWDDPKTYDLADKLKAQGFDSTVTQQGKDMVTLFHKSAEDVSPVLNAKTPYDFGKAYGYTDNDIAAFYNNRYGKDAEKYWKQDSKFLPAKTDFEKAQDLAQQRAALPISEGGLGLPVTNTYIDRAKAMGNVSVYHGGNDDIRVPSYAHSGKGADQYGSASLYTATSPYNAGGYVKPLDMITGENTGGNIMPLMVNPTNFLDADKIQALSTAQIKSIINKSPDKYALSNFGDINYEGKEKVLMQAINAYKDVGDGSVLSQLNMLNNDFYKGNPEAFNKAAQEATGYKGVTVDIGSGEKFIMPWETSNIRSRFAAFDPFRRNEADILAGVAPLAVGSLLGLNTYNNMQEKPKKETKKTK
jgi:hypothetical protein